VPGDADLEIGLRWDRRRNELYSNLRFEIWGGNTDERGQPDEPIVIDEGVLQDLDADEEDYGKALTEMVLRPADVGRFYRKALAIAEHDELTVHLRLHINAPPRFHALRWESLRDPETGARIATESNVLMSRYLSSPDWRPIIVPPKHDLRALVVVAGPSDIETFEPDGRSLAPVNVEEEVERARAALRECTEVTVLDHETATLTAMLDALDDGVDVLYLVCHGVLRDDVPLLYLVKPDGRADPVDGRRFAERLQEQERRPTVALLSSCQSASRGDEWWSDDSGELSAFGPRLAAAGVSAVVGMQGNVSMATANGFAPAFFNALAEDGVVDRAMATARREVRDSDDWWVPVLYSRLRSGRTYYKPEFTERSSNTWQVLRLQISTGNFTPLLGPGLADSILGSRQDMARSFVERWQMPLARHSQGDLAQVAQYLRVRGQPGAVRSQLFEHLGNEIEKRIARADEGQPFHGLVLDPERPDRTIREVGSRLREADAGDPYRVMAALPVKIYITTAWTDLLQDALLARDPPRVPTTIVFPWQPTSSGEGVAELGEPTVEQPLVYHLFGRLDDRRSLVLTEEDYFAWFAAWMQRRKDIPDVIRAALVDKSLLFLGFRLDDWDFRVIFHAIKSFGGSSVLLQQNLHVGVQLSPESQLIEPEAAQEYLESYFGNDKISIYWGETRSFLDELRARTKLVT
jgi:hypothetical protein